MIHINNLFNKENDPSTEKLILFHIIILIYHFILKDDKEKHI